jgi:hypothetical protein
MRRGMILSIDYMNNVCIFRRICDEDDFEFNEVILFTCGFTIMSTLGFVKANKHFPLNYSL